VNLRSRAVEFGSDRVSAEIRALGCNLSLCNKKKERSHPRDYSDSGKGTSYLILVRINRYIVPLTRVARWCGLASERNRLETISILRTILDARARLNSIRPIDFRAAPQRIRPRNPNRRADLSIGLPGRRCAHFRVTAFATGARARARVRVCRIRRWYLDRGSRNWYLTCRVIARMFSNNRRRSRRRMLRRTNVVVGSALSAFRTGATREPTR